MFINHLSFFNFSFLGGGGGGVGKTKNRVHGPGPNKWFTDPVQNGGVLCLAHFLIDLKSCVSQTSMGNIKSDK